MKRGPFPLIPIGLIIATLVALQQLLNGDHMFTWAFVLTAISLAATTYSASQEARANEAISLARQRGTSVPYDEVQREVDRARRQDRPLSIARLAMRSSQQTTDLLRQLVGARSRSVMRSSDRAWRQGRDIYLLLPDTDHDSATHMLRRIQALQDATLDAPRVVTLPHDALTIGALFEMLGAPRPADDALIPGLQPQPTAPQKTRANDR